MFFKTTDNIGIRYMKVNPVAYNDNKGANGTSFKGMPVKTLIIPESLGRAAKLTGAYVNTPEQKLFLATTALMFTPLIDLKYARDDKQTDAAIKSASKAMAGGITGVGIRAGFNYMFSKNVGFGNEKLNPYFYPSALDKLIAEKPALAELRLNQYCKTMGTLFAVAFMILYSNKNVDVPLTSDFQDLLSGVIKENKTWTQSFGDVANTKAEKIKNKIDTFKKELFGIRHKVAKINKIIKGEKPEDNTTDNKGGVR